MKHIMWTTETLRNAQNDLWALFEPMPDSEREKWCLLTIMSPRLWAPRHTLTHHMIPLAHRAIKRQFAQHLPDVNAIFILDIVSDVRFSGNSGEIGWSLHYHCLINIRFDDRAARRRVRKALSDWTGGQRGLKFLRPDARKGGIKGWVEYGLKDLRNVLTKTKISGQRQPANDSRTREMREFIEPIPPIRMIASRGIKRVHGKFVPWRKVR